MNWAFEILNEAQSHLISLRPHIDSVIGIQSSHPIMFSLCNEPELQYSSHTQKYKSSQFHTILLPSFIIFHCHS